MARVSRVVRYSVWVAVEFDAFYDEENDEWAPVNAGEDDNYRDVEDALRKVPGYSDHDYEDSYIEEL